MPIPSPQTAIRRRAQSRGGPSAAKLYLEPKVGHRLPPGETAPVRPQPFVIQNASEV